MSELYVFCDYLVCLCHYCFSFLNVYNKHIYNRLLLVCTRQTDCQLSVHTNVITVYRNLVNSLADFNLSGST